MSEDLSASASGHAGLRASDADREQLIDELQTHTIAGRLSTDELEERTQAAYAARTNGELAALRRDLPAATPARSDAHGQRRAQLIRRMMQETGGTVSLFAVSTVIWLASGAQGQFWPVWVLILVVMSLARNGWAVFGPAPDLDAVEADLDARRARRLERSQHRAERRGR